MKKPININYKKILSIVFTLAILILMVLYLNKNKEIFENLKYFKLKDILIIAIIQPINVAVIALTNKLIIDHIDQKIPFGELFMLQYSNNFLNKFIAEGGAAFRGIYMKTQYSFPFSKFLSSLGGNYIANILANCVLGIILLLVVFLKQNIFNIYIFAIFIFIIFGILIFSIFNPKIKSENTFFKKINNVLIGWNSIKNNKKLVVQLILLSIVSSIISAYSVLIVYQGLNADFHLINSLLYGAISGIANVINLTPGGLGVNEAVLIFSSKVIGLSNEMIILGSLLLRAITMIVSIVFGGICFLILNFKMQKNLSKQ